MEETAEVMPSRRRPLGASGGWPKLVVRRDQPHRLSTPDAMNSEHGRASKKSSMPRWSTRPASAELTCAATADDDSVRAEVDRLLDAQLESTEFIEQPAATTLLSGRVISHYEIGRLIGSGGMGHVYAARDTELGREVALKVASFGTETPKPGCAVKRSTVAAESSPHLHIYDVGRADGQLFVVMELVKGQSLADLVREGSLSIANARRYAIEIADALAHAHEQGVTHRDLRARTS